MSVACCPLQGADDAYDVSVVNIRRAAKSHDCEECRDPIKPGDRYENYRGLGGGSWYEHKTCLSCVEIRDHFACNGWLFGQLWEDLEGNFFPDMKAGGPCMQGLSPAAKGRLFERRMAWIERRAS